MFAGDLRATVHLRLPLPQVGRRRLRGALPAVREPARRGNVLRVRADVHGLKMDKISATTGTETRQ